jgi:acyl homoserine lactone synthase
MIHITQGYSLADARHASMFRDRKTLFVDLLGWDVPVIDDQFEIDRYDTGAALYLIALDEEGRHIGSMRLLPTVSPHLLSNVFAELCESDIPRGPTVLEITRLCLPQRLGCAGRLTVRNRLVTAMVDYALAGGITALTGVVTAAYREQVLAMGWRAEPLGAPRSRHGAMLGAFRIEIDADTPALLAANGIYVAEASIAADAA